MKTVIYNSFMAVIICLVLTTSLAAQDGQLDITFDGDGILTTQIGTGNDFLTDIVLDQNGKIVVVGTYNNAASHPEMFVVRYNNDGSLDNTFDSDGIKTIAVGEFDDRAYAVSIQPDGKIVITGISFDGTYNDLALIRLNTDGSYDTSFDSDGIVTSNAMFGGPYDLNVRDLEIQDDGKIVVVGFQKNTFINPIVDIFVVYRFNTDGTLDNTFSADGKQNINFPSRNAEPSIVKLQSNGKIIIAGLSYNASNDYDYTLARLTSTGELDVTFGTSGIILTSIGNTWDAIWDMDIYNDDKIIVVGNSYMSTNKYDISLARYSANGVLDNTFGTNGIVTTNFDSVNNYDENGTGIKILSNNKIVVCGTANLSSSQFVVVRYNSNGSLDTSFDTDGFVFAGGSSSEVAKSKAIAIQENGSIVIGGDINASTYDVILMRFIGETTYTTPFFQNFDGVTSPALPYGWLIENTNGDGVWANGGLGPVHSAPNAMSYDFHGASAADDWFFTPGLNLKAGVTYEVIFYYSAGQNFFPEKLEVKWGSTQNSAGMTSPAIFDNININNTEYLKGTGEFTLSDSGLFYIGWHCYSPAFQDYVFVDDILIRVKPAATNDQVIPAGGTNPITFTGTGSIVQFTTNNGGELQLTCDKILSSPGGALPGGLTNLAPLYWSITVTSGTVNGTYSLTLEITGVSGVTNFATLHLLKRDDANRTWTDFGVATTIDGNLLTWTGLTSFSDFGLGSDKDIVLPVDDIKINSGLPTTAELMDNYPNPFNPSTAIKFYIPNNSEVSIKIYDMLGKEVTTLINKELNPGYHIVYWNGRDSFGNSVSSGVYLYRLTAGSFIETKKMALLK